MLFDISNTANYTNCVNILSTGNSNNGVYVSISGNTEATSYGVNSLAGSANSIAGYFHKSVADANNPVLYVTAANSTSLALSVIGKAICSSGTWSGSDRNIKSQIKSESVLNRLKQIEITSWKYNQDKIDTIENEKHKDDEKYEKVKRSKQLGATNQPKHFGAMAEEFNTIFATSDGDSDALCYTDTIGVALRAIQELSAQLDDLKREVRLYKRILNISQEQINTERDNTANRKLAIAQYRQAKHEARLAQEPQEEMRPAT